MVSCYFDSRFFNNSCLKNVVCFILALNRNRILCGLHLALYAFCSNYYQTLDWTLFKLLKEKLQLFISVFQSTVTQIFLKPVWDRNFNAKFNFFVGWGHLTSSAQDQTMPGPEETVPCSWVGKVNRTVTLPTWIGFKCFVITVMWITKAGMLRWEPPVLVNRNRGQSWDLTSFLGSSNWNICLYLNSAELDQLAENGCLNLKYFRTQGTLLKFLFNNDPSWRKMALFLARSQRFQPNEAI